jgi:SET domain-containing protein
MMLVETELRPSPIHGLGVFLLQPVSKGDLIWRFDARIDRVYTEAEIARSP